jgi:hypothetical protein
LTVATDEELKAWAAGDDVEGAKRGKGRSAFAASWFGSQAAIIAGGSLLLAFVASAWWLLALPVAGLLAARAVQASQKQATWDRLYRGDDSESVI